MALRHQLAAYSPVSVRGILQGAQQLIGLGRDPRPVLAREIQEEFGADSVILCGSGTQALAVAITQARNETDPTAPIALPAFSCFDLASAAIGASAPVVFYDIEPDTLSPDPGSLERAMRAGARVVVVSPLYGIPQDWESIVSLVSRHDGRVIQDVAQGGGATWRGTKLGSLGQMATISFGRAKGWTGGSGGALLIRGGSAGSGSLVDSSRTLRGLKDVLAITAQYLLGRPGTYGIPTAIPALRLGQTVYREPVMPHPISRAAAAIVLATRTDATHEAEMRKRNAAKIVDAVSALPNVRTIRVDANAVAGFLRLPVRLRRGMNSFVSRTRAVRLGIAPGYPLSLASLKQLTGLRVESGDTFTGAQTLVRELVTLPTHSLLEQSDIEQIAQLMETVSA